MTTLAVSIDTPDPRVLAEAATVIEQGGIVAYPTDTLYGLAVDPRNDTAVARLFAVKGRHAAKAISLIAATIEQVMAAATLTSDDERLARAFWPGPLTLLLAPRASLVPRLTAEGPTVGVRIPAHAIARALAARAGFAITATSANRAGRPAAVTSDEVAAGLGDDVDLILDAGPTVGGPPSTIVATGPSGPKLVRVGAVAWDRVLESLK
jgi:L-threonylcarbamoyladenylate synthase